MCCISKYLWAKTYICGLKKNIYVLKRIFVDMKIYLWTKKYTCGHKNIFVDIKIYLWT